MVLEVPEPESAAQPGAKAAGLPQQVGAVIAAFVVGAALGASGSLPQLQVLLTQREATPGQVPGTRPVEMALSVPSTTVEMDSSVPALPKMASTAAVSRAAAASAKTTDLPRPIQQELMRKDDKLAGWYIKLMEAAREAGGKIQNVMKQGSPKQGSSVQEKAAPSRLPPSVVKQIRGIEDILDEAQTDVYDEVWVSLETYPQILEAYLPVLNYYADNAFPDSGDETQRQINKAQRDALRFEVQSYLRSILKLDRAIQQRKVRAVEEAFAKTSLAYDRYLKAGDLYTGYDPVTSTTIFFRNIVDTDLVYTPLALEQPRIRDEVLVLQGPDKGKVGRVMWLGRENANDPSSKVLSAVVKLEPNPVLGSTPQSRGIKEVKAYPYNWIVLTRSSTQSYARDFVLATLAAVVSCGLTYPLDSVKCRAQLNLPPIPPEGPLALLSGVELNVLREAPNAGFLMAGFNLLTRQAVGLPFIDANNPNLKFLLMIPSGILAMASGSIVKVPLMDISKQVQAGTAANLLEAVENVYFKPPPSAVIQKLATVATLTVIKGIPFGAFQCFIYEIMKDKTPDLLEAVGCPIAAEPFIWGAVAGFCTGFLTNPPDVIITRMAVSQGKQDGSEEFDLGAIWSRIVEATEDVYREEGPGGFLKGGLENAIYFAPEAMIWFGVYEVLKEAVVMLE